MSAWRGIRWGDTETLEVSRQNPVAEGKDLVSVPSMPGVSHARIWALSWNVLPLQVPFPGVTLDRSVIELYAGTGSAMAVYRIPIPLPGVGGPFFVAAQHLRARVVLASSVLLPLTPIRWSATLAVAPTSPPTYQEIPS